MMLKVRGQANDGHPVIILGLTPRNCVLLQEGKPIIFSLAELGLNGHVVIMGGASPEEMLAELQGNADKYGPTDVRDGPPPKGSLTEGAPNVPPSSRPARRPDLRRGVNGLKPGKRER